MANPHELRTHDPDAPLPYTLKVKGQFWYFRHRKFGTIRLPGEYRSRQFMQKYHGILRKHGLIYQPRQTDKRQVYFIGWEGGPIKIGVGGHHQRRVVEMQTSCPYELKLLAWADGGRLQEQAYHRRFAAYNIRGEWFEPRPMILNEIERLQKTGRLYSETRRGKVKTGKT